MRLSRAYARTEYCVLLQSPIILRVDHYDAAAERRLLQECGPHRAWAVLTPCNPRSRRVSGLLNRRYLRELRQTLTALKLRHAPTLNRDPLHRWPDEPGFLLLDARPQQLLGLARHFRQNAALAGALGQPPGLLWL